MVAMMVRTIVKMFRCENGRIVQVRLFAFQLLEEFSEDKAFLESISSKVADNNKLFEEVESGLNFLIVRKNFWRQHGTNIKM